MGEIIIRKFFLINIFLLQLFFAYMPIVEAGNSMIYPVEYPMIVTSPFGYRVHPIAGDIKYHSGVDLACDYGTIIVAAGDGTVTFAGWISGYGNAVIIDHGGGIETLYGHNDGLCVSSGETVSAGALIAYGGSTGNSTGPHCHFELNIDGEHVDPGLYVPGLLQAEIHEGGGNSTDYDGFAVSFESNVDFAKPLKDIVDTFVDTITRALGLIKNSVYQIFMILLTIDFCLALMWRGFGDGNDNLINWVVFRIVLYGMMMFLLSEWGEIVGGMAINGLPALGGMAAGSTSADAAKILSDPTNIIQRGVQIITPIINEALKIKSITDAVAHNSTAILCLILGIIFFICFCIIGIQLAYAYLEFYMVILFSFTGYMLAGLKHTRKYGSNSLNGVFAASINLMFFCMFATSLGFMMENIAVGSFIENHKVTIESQASPTGHITSKEDLMMRMRIVESYGGNYHCDNGLGYYGAYQINKDYWDRWCEYYIDNSGGYLQTDDSGYVRFNEYGPYDTAPEPSTYYPWSPGNQDLVTAFILEGYYSEFGSWEAAGMAWNQGIGGMNNSDAQEYKTKLLSAKGSSQMGYTETVLNMALLFKLLLVVLLYIYIADRINRAIMRQFGGIGFRLTNEQ